MKNYFYITEVSFFAETEEKAEEKLKEYLDSGDCDDSLHDINYWVLNSVVDDDEE